MELSLRHWWERCKGNPARPWMLVGGLVGTLGVLLLTFHVLPLSTGVFFASTLLVTAVALVRPRCVFFVLIATLPFETINLVPETFGFTVRPYQWLLIILAVTLGVRFLARWLTWPLVRFSALDGFLALIPLGALVSGLLFGGDGIRLAIIVASFYGLYLVSRVFLVDTAEAYRALTVLLASGFVSVLYGIGQNIAFEQGMDLNTVMPGRPNGAFTEPDWFGFFVTVLLLIALAHIDRVFRRLGDAAQSILPAAGAFTLLLTPLIIALILTVSRSAWLSAAAAIVMWLATWLALGGRASIARLLPTAHYFVIVSVIALIIVVDVPLTRFELFQRAESTATGRQTITVACETPTTPPAQIVTLEELSAYRCRHINLEERDALREAGYFIETTSRPDPNVEIRSAIYTRAWQEIRTHPVFGIGWGNIGTLLGKDENGSAYNASNVWFELWLGAGILGVAGLGLALGYVFLRGLDLLRGRIDGQVDAVPLAFASLTAFVVFNLFNAGLLIGIIWVGWAFFPLLFTRPNTDSSL